MPKKNNKLESNSRGVASSVVTEIRTDIDLRDIRVNEESIPLLPLVNIVLFPGIPTPVNFECEEDIILAKDAESKKEAIFVTSYKEGKEDSAPTIRTVATTGVICVVAKVIELPNKTVTAFLLPGNVAKLQKVYKKTADSEPYYRCEVKTLTEVFPSEDDLKMDTLIEQLHNVYTTMLDFVPEHERQEILFGLKQQDSIAKKLNYMSFNSPIDISGKQAILAELNIKKRAMVLMEQFNLAYQKMEIKAEIQMRTEKNLSQQQKEHFLQQQMRTIREELGDAEADGEIEELRLKGEKKLWSEAAKSHFEKELKKLARYNPQNPEYSVQYSYLETLLNLPWDDMSDSKIDLDKIEKVLNEDHHGLEKVKERILEHMAVLSLRGDMKSPILCLYGPPGVGKTSLGKSIARAIDREYARVSLGGLHDEAEIRGHRRTYIGAMPGRIISALAKCGKGNPVFVLDEIDKIGSDFKGDPSTALLEVLDSEQNNKFHDNYVDFDYDISKVMFIATANSLSSLSRPLLDRMEIIEIDGYITEEKIEIASRHLIPRKNAEHGFENDEIIFETDAIKYIIERFTRESGVRQLEKQIAKVLRKVATLKARGKDYPTAITVNLVKEFLGKELVNPEMYENNDFIGVVTGLAWTSVGGEILFIESSLSKGKGEKLTLTGNLGDVMKESAVIALQYLKANAEKYGLDAKEMGEYDVHIHVPEGAIPKDGPSAGITMVTSLASSFTQRKVKDHLAMTGEITLRGKVLPVGGIKEKILAAKRAGITDIILCEDNRKDIDEIPQLYLEGLKFHYVSKIEEVLEIALI